MDFTISEEVCAIESVWRWDELQTEVLNWIPL
jgi:hypothetical protein